MQKEMKNYVWTIQRQLESVLKDSLAVIGVFPRAWIWKEVVRNLRLQTHWILLQNFAGSGHPIFRGTRALEREENLRSKGGGKTAIHFNDSTQNMELLLQMVISINQLSLYGAVADMIEELPVARIRATIWKIVRSYPGCAPKQVSDLSKLDNSSMLLRHQEEKNIHVYAEKIHCFEVKKEFEKKGWIQSNVRFGPVSDIKVCNQHGRYSIEVQVQSLFQDQTVSWIRIVKGIDKFVRCNADPRGRESFGETRCKSETKIKTVINKWLGLYSDWTETMDGHWNTGIQGSLLFSSVEIHHSTTTTQSKSLSRRKWSSPLWPSCWWIQEKAIRQMLNIGQTRWRSTSSMFSNGRQKNWVSVLAKGGGEKKRFQYCWNPSYPHQFLCLRKVQGHSGSTINPALQDNVLLPEGFTE